MGDSPDPMKIPGSGAALASTIPGPSVRKVSSRPVANAAPANCFVLKVRLLSPPLQLTRYKGRLS
jgi:hypothetical protein